MALSVNVTINMPPEMVDDVDEQAESHGMSRAEYVRHLIQQAEDSPFPRPEQSLRSTDGETEEGAA